MRISIVKSTSRIIEAQSDPNPLQYSVEDLLSAEERNAFKARKDAGEAADALSHEIANVVEQRAVTREDRRRMEALDTLRQNAISAGFTAEDVDVLYVPDETVAAALETQRAADMTYADRRLAEYPSIGDQLDALWQGGEAAEAMRSRIMAVKAKYPSE